jgi:hypothetical protein
VVLLFSALMWANTAGPAATPNISENNLPCCPQSTSRLRSRAITLWHLLLAADGTYSIDPARVEDVILTHASGNPTCEISQGTATLVCARVMRGNTASS